MSTQFSPYSIDPDIRQAATLPGRFYRDPAVFIQHREQLFPSSWQFLPLLSQPEHNAYPFTLLPGLLDTPVLLTRKGDNWHALSNVCTHRGASLLNQATLCKTVRCPYHGRSFALDGRMLAMPAFDQAANFPGPADHLPHLALNFWGPFAFVSLNPAVPFASWSAALDQYFSWVPWDQFRFSAEHSQDFSLAAHWALYVDNYLEGLHIPYVHPALNQALDFKAYLTTPLEHGVLQVGLAAAGEDCFDLAADHPDYGKSIAAYYLWLFPNLMFNLYPWGLSLNLIEPIGLEQTRVRYFTWIWDKSRLNQGAGANVGNTEHEDHSVILRVQQGIKSPLYDRGRYSPTMEQGVHRFHQLLTTSYNSSPTN